MSSKSIETVYPSWNMYFIEKPTIAELSDKRIMLTGKCKSCFGSGRMYRGGDYESCKTCNSYNGIFTIITKKIDV